MSRNNTLNPIGSDAFLDFQDNVKNLDDAVNSMDPYWTDRFGNQRLPIHEMEVQFNEAQDARADSFSNFIRDSGYEFIGDYSGSIEITGYNQVLRDSNGEFWRVSGSVDLPYITSGSGLPEGGNFVSVGDAALRQEIGTMAYENVCDSVSDIKSLFAEDNDLVYLKGVASNNGGFFAFNASSTEAPDDDNVIESIVTPIGRWIRLDFSGYAMVPSVIYRSSSGSGAVSMPASKTGSIKFSSNSGVSAFDRKKYRPRAIGKPSGFTFGAPFSIWKEFGGAVRTDFDVSKYRYVGDGTVEYVDPVNGNESNDGLSWATAKRDIANALHVRSASTIYLAPGIYHRSDTHDWGASKISRSVSVICQSGVAIVSRRAGGASLPPSSQYDGDIYVVSRSNVLSIYDSINYDEHGDYLKFPQLNSMAELSDSDYGYFRDGASTYIKRIDGIQPDYKNTCIFLVEAVPCSGQTGNSHVYLENIHFEGGNSCFDIDPTSGDEVIKFYANGCSFKYSTGSGGGGDGLSVFGATEVMLQNCTGSRTWNDVVSYHVDTVTSPSVIGRAIEVDCVWRRGGEDNQPSSNNNGSTGHDAWSILRVNVQSYLNGGPQIADVSGCKSWLVGCSLYDGRGSGSVDGLQSAGSGGEMWVDSCVIHSMDKSAVLTNSSGVIHFRDSEIDGTVQANGGTTVDAY